MNKIDKIKQINNLATDIIEICKDIKNADKSELNDIDLGRIVNSLIEHKDDLEYINESYITINLD